MLMPSYFHAMRYIPVEVFILLCQLYLTRTKVYMMLGLALTKLGARATLDERVIQQLHTPRAQRASVIISRAVALPPLHSFPGKELELERSAGTPNELMKWP